MQSNIELERPEMEQRTADLATHGNIVQVAGVDLAFRPVPISDRTPTARQILATLNHAPHHEYVVLQWLPGGDIEEVRPEEQIDMTSGASPRLIIARSDRTFRLVLNERSLEWPDERITEAALRTLGAIDPAQRIYLTKEDEADVMLESGASVNLRRAGTETFYSKADVWKLNVQGVTIVSEQPEISVHDALTEAGFDTGAAWIIVLKTASVRKQVAMDYVIDLREPGIEKLRLTPREINNGEAFEPRRRDFALLPADEDWLDAGGYSWTTLVDGGRRWLLLRDVALPAGYTSPSTTIAMEVPTAYPMAEIDMFYCHPSLARSDGQIIPQTDAVEVIGGRTFQRWSRHRGAIAPWRPGRDSVVTHLLLIDASLTREVEQ